MNRIQIVVIWIWIFLMTLCTLFPPWLRVGQPIGDDVYLDQVYIGRSFLFSPPDLSESIRYRSSQRWRELDEEAKTQLQEKWLNESRAHHVVEVGRLLASWSLVSLICFAVLLAFQRPQARQKES